MPINVGDSFEILWDLLGFLADLIVEINGDYFSGLLAQVPDCRTLSVKAIAKPTQLKILF